MKMRVMYSSKKAKFVTYAEAIGQACGCLVNDIPPAYPADKERLVLIGITAGSSIDDKVRRFCNELVPQRAQNVALFVDGAKGTKAEQEVIQALKNAGTNIIDDTYYVKCGIFGSKITLEERQAIVDWARRMQDIVSND